VSAVVKAVRRQRYKGIKALRNSTLIHLYYHQAVQLLENPDVFQFEYYERGRGPLQVAMDALVLDALALLLSIIQSQYTTLACRSQNVMASHLASCRAS
jgi:hypothetical protein